jgi:succinate dehydrogenase / fumarate reductase flavoprotein subunit
MKLDTKIPEGPLEQKWENYKKNAKLVNPANRKKLKLIVVGTGLAGSSAAASFAEMGYNVEAFCFQDSPRRAHSVAAQGGVNASKNYKNDGDSVYRMFKDTLKGGDYRSREASVYRLAECSMSLIDQAVAQGVPFGREYSGYLNNRSFGGVQVSRTFYSRGQTGQQLLLGSYQAMMRQVGVGKIILHASHEMLDLVVIDGKARGIISRNLITGELKRHVADAVIIASGGFGKIFYLSTLAMGCNGSAIYRAYKKGACIANPSWTQIHPTSLPQSGKHQSKLTLMSESLRNDGRIWVPKNQHENRAPHEIPEDERDYYLERRYPAFGNLAPRDIASRAAKERIDAGYGVGAMKNAVYLDFSKAINEYGQKTIEERYGNLFTMYEKITGINAYKEPMKISPAAHFSMGGLWVDYELMTSLNGLFALGEANFADHGANRLGANSLLQACVDGYFVAPYTVSNYLADELKETKITTDHEAFVAAEKQVISQLERFISCEGNRSVDSFHKELGKLLYDYCGLSRTKEGLAKAMDQIKELKSEFYKNVRVPGTKETINAELEKAGRVADYFDIALLMCQDAYERDESCGAHFREEYQTPDGEALRDDENFQFSSVWKFEVENNKASLIKEKLVFEYEQPTTRSYK